MATLSHRIFRKIKHTIFPPNFSPLRESDNGTYIFIHINKTAGTSIANAIGLPQKKHLTAKETIDIVGKENFERAYKFAVVRNPWDRVVSHYKFRVKTNQTQMAKTKITFKDWVQCTYGEVKDKFYYNKPRMFQPQVGWLKDYDEKINIDNILKFENLNEDFDSVAKTLGIKNTLAHLNKTKKTNYKNYYDEETKTIVANWFKEDIERFGYTFDGNNN